MVNKKQIIGIYKITSPSGKIYIGQATDINRRWRKYKWLNCKKQTKLFNSLNRYGAENHKFEIVHECKEEELNDLEIHYIKLFDCFNSPNGLNLREGGSGGRPSQETKDKISKANKGKTSWIKGKKMSDEQRLNISGENSHLFGKKKSDETRKKMSESRKGKKQSPEFVAKRFQIIKKNKEEKIANGTYTKKVVSEETRRKKSGKNNPMFGKKPSDETILKREATRIKNKEEKILNGTYKKRIVSEEQRQHLSEINIGKKLSAETIEKLSGENSVHFGKKRKESSIQKQVESQKGRVFTEEHKRNLSESQKGKKHSIETRNKMKETKIMLRQERLTMIF